MGCYRSLQILVKKQGFGDFFHLQLNTWRILVRVDSVRIDDNIDLDNSEI